MKGQWRILIIGICGIALLSGCASMGAFPHATGTEVDLNKKNYRVVKANVTGESTGFALFGIIPFVSPTYPDAMSNLSANGGIQEGKAQALVNVTQDRSVIYLILFSIPKLTVRADIIEFLDDPKETNVSEPKATTLSK